MKCPDWLKATDVEEVCSVSECISKAPEGWIDEWRYNELWLAWSVVPEGTRQELELYA